MKDTDKIDDYTLEVEEDENEKRHTIIYIFLSIIVLFCLTLLYSRYISTSIINIKETPIYTNKIDNEFDGFKIVQISDILYGSTISNKKLDNIVKKVNELKPDIVVFTGDIISSDYKIHDNDIKNITKSLDNIEAKIGKYAIRGDNDYKNDTFIEIIENADFKYLDDSYDLIYSNLNKYVFIAGLNSSIKSKNNYDQINSFEGDAYKIIIMHEPDNIDVVLKNTSADVVLAGHSLLGQFRLPFMGGISYYKGSNKYTESYYNFKGTKLYVSGGLGTNNYPFRFFNRPEINLYRIIKK